MRGAMTGKGAVVNTAVIVSRTAAGIKTVRHQSLQVIDVVPGNHNSIITTAAEDSRGVFPGIPLYWVTRIDLN